MKIVYGTTVEKKELRCETCGGTLVVDDIIDSDYLNGFVVNKIIGHCEHCDNNYAWDEYFEFIGCANFKID